jgi:hypothetical protein
MVRFANCMRSHGVTNLPDPEASPYDFKFAFSPSSGNLRSPTFQSADAACQHLLPGGGEPNHGAPPSHAQTVALLALARCMRSHGFRDFPDPNNGGEITHEMLATAGLNLHQPAFAQDADDCVSVTHGLITKARVARFIAGQ